MLEMRHVSKAFASVKALDDLCLTVPQGAVYGLVGPNGAGKSTAIRLLTGIYRQDAGSVTLEGLPVYENPKVKKDIVCISDEPFWFPSATLEEMARFYRGIYPGFDKGVFSQLQQVFNLPRKSPIRRLSKGMQKQAAFQLALAARPRVLILDEPVDGLDPVTRRQVWSLILTSVAENGTTVLVSSHNLCELEDVCDHVGIMAGGRMLLERSLAGLQGTVHKLQLVGDTPQGLEILHEGTSGRLRTLIVRGDAGDIARRTAAGKPAYFDILPLSLEEIFIYELGGVNPDVQEILL